MRGIVVPHVESVEAARQVVDCAYFAPAGNRVYVGGGSRAAIFEFDFANGKLTAGRTFDTLAGAPRAQDDFIGDVAMSPDGRLLYCAALYRNVIKVINPQSGMLLKEYEIKTGRVRFLA